VFKKNHDVGDHRKVCTEVLKKGAKEGEADHFRRGDRVSCNQKDTTREEGGAIKTALRVEATRDKGREMVKRRIGVIGKN